jgi:hypothetical protein
MSTRDGAHLHAVSVLECPPLHTVRLQEESAGPTSEDDEKPPMSPSTSANDPGFSRMNWSANCTDCVLAGLLWIFSHGVLSVLTRGTRRRASGNEPGAFA